MLIITFIAFLLGIIRYRYWAYWKWALILLAWIIVGPILFAGGGTLENPAGDGIVSHQVRIATKDGPEMALFGLAFLVVFYGGVIWFIRRIYLATKERDSTPGGAQTVSVARKALEVAALCITTLGLVYLQYAELLARRSTTSLTQELPVHGGSPENENAPDPIAQQLEKVAAEITAKGNQKLDPMTTLDSASAQGRTLTYHYRLSRRDGSDDELVAFIRKTILPKVCSNADMREGIDKYGVIYRYSYLFPNSTTPVIVDIDAAACSGR